MSGAVRVILPCWIVLSVIGIPSSAGSNSNRTSGSRACAEVATALSRLLPDGLDGKVAPLSAAERRRLIKQLEVDRPRLAATSCGSGVAFCLALVGREYGMNRDALVRTLRRCEDRESRCDEDSAVYLAALYRDGHRELLGPLVEGGASSDGALSEALGSFYQEVLLNDSKAFVFEIEKLPPGAQQRDCFLAGGGDGSGASPADANRINDELRAIDTPAGRVCALSFQAGVASSR